MALFDLIKDPERAEVPPGDVLEEPPPQEVTQVVEVPEIELLRASAREADARAEAASEFAMDELAERFLAMCLAQARQSSKQPYIHDREALKDFDHQRGALRIVAIPALTGDWPTVLAGREAALATVAELRRRGFGAPVHDYRRIEGVWELRIRFSF